MTKTKDFIAHKYATGQKTTHLGPKRTEGLVVRDIEMITAHGVHFKKSPQQPFFKRILSRFKC